MTGTAFHDIVSGIPRFVREVARAAYGDGDALPVVLREGALWTIYDETALRRRVEFEAGDVLLVPDVHSRHVDAYLSLLPALRASAGRLVVFVHDVIPLTHPATCYRGLPEGFARWFAFLAEHADALITLCGATAATIREALTRRTSRIVPIGWVAGATSLEAASKPPSPALGTALAATSPCFLMVGTMEPRKGHALALEAFERLWAGGFIGTLLILGHRGWGTRHVERRIESHPRLGTSLFWLRDADDDDLAHAYGACAALLAPSIVEGFGLTLVEAASFGAHRVASDTPVFREVGGDDAISYFAVCDVQALADAIASAPIRPGDSGTVPPRSWRQASREIFAMVRDERYQDGDASL